MMRAYAHNHPSPDHRQEFVMPATARVRSESTDQRHESHLLAVRGDDTADDTAVAIASMHAMGSGTLADFQALYTADAVNREAKAEPPDTRGTGPAALYATARWLRTAFSELTWKVHDVAHDNDLVVVHATMSGRQTGPFVAYRPDAKVAAVFPPRGRTFTVTQTHWFRMYDGKVAEHWANRDDLGMGQQLGWNPPTPLYLVRMLLASRRARRR
jgi:predicted ester cyclase